MDSEWLLNLEKLIVLHLSIECRNWIQKQVKKSSYTWFHVKSIRHSHLASSNKQVLIHVWWKQQPLKQHGVLHLFPPQDFRTCRQVTQQRRETSWAGNWFEMKRREKSFWHWKEGLEGVTNRNSGEKKKSLLESKLLVCNHLQLMFKYFI